MKTETIKQIEDMRYEWRVYAVVDDSFENVDISLNADGIADWWISHFHQKLLSMKGEMDGRKKEMPLLTDEYSADARLLINCFNDGIDTAISLLGIK